MALGIYGDVTINQFVFQFESVWIAGKATKTMETLSLSFNFSF